LLVVYSEREPVDNDLITIDHVSHPPESFVGLRKESKPIEVLKKAILKLSELVRLDRRAVVVE